MARYPSTPACRFLSVTLIQCLLVLSVVACSRPERADQRATRLTDHQAANRPSPEVMSTHSLNHLSKPQQPDDDLAMTNSNLERQLTDAITNARKGGKGQVVYEYPTLEQLRDYRDFIAASLVRRNFSSIPAPPQFDATSIGDDYELLSEARIAKRGAGIVVLRKAPSAPLCVEVPHSFFDEGSLDIGLQLFLQSNAQLLMVNTAHRYRTTNDRPPPHSKDTDRESNDTNRADSEIVISSDVAHSARSFFLAAHEAVVNTAKDTTTIQIHGYANASAPNFDIIVSAARTKTKLTSLIARLRADLRLRVASYPDDIRQLGGTTNVEAKYSRVKGACFVHLELSESLRNRLKNENQLMTRFVHTVAQESRCD